MRWFILPAAAVLICPAIAAAQQVPSDAVLTEISRRGRLLHEYDRAAWHATDVVLASWTNPKGVDGFIARKDSTGTWQAIFGRLSEGGDTLLIAAIATQGMHPDSFVAAILETPQPASERDRHAFHALMTASADLSVIQRPFAGVYNPYVLPRPEGGWLVYFLPSRGRSNTIVHGGDFRYEISVDGGTIEARTQMHRALISGDLPGNAVAGMHTEVVSDLPQESDVFLVLSRAPRKPEVVMTERFLFEIDVEGVITWSAVEGPD